MQNTNEVKEQRLCLLGFCMVVTSSHTWLFKFRFLFKISLFLFLKLFNYGELKNWLPQSYYHISSVHWSHVATILDNMNLDYVHHCRVLLDSIVAIGSERISLQNKCLNLNMISEQAMTQWTFRTEGRIVLVKESSSI